MGVIARGSAERGKHFMKMCGRQAFDNHFAERDAIKVPWLLHPGLCHDLWRRLGEYDGIDVLTLDSITPLIWTGGCEDSYC